MFFDMAFLFRIFPFLSIHSAAPLHSRNQKKTIRTVGQCFKYDPTAESEVATSYCCSRLLVFPKFLGALPFLGFKKCNKIRHIVKA